MQKKSLTEVKASPIPLRQSQDPHSVLQGSQDLHAPPSPASPSPSELSSLSTHYKGSCVTTGQGLLWYLEPRLANGGLL